jgi:hydroxymethylglutaryl-CoA synthase
MTTSLAAVAGALASSSFRRLSSLESDSNPTNNPDSSNDNNNNNKHVGIVAMQVYTPCTYVQQSHLEEYSGVDAGRYTIGLGQQGLAVTGDAEDVNSLALTVVHSLLEDYQIDVSEIGRVEVGTESLIDKSKSTKTVLMDLFSGQTDIEGATVVNACYGGTAALWNAVHWCESDGWNHKYALVVAADIATYARGPARPTSGVGAVAVLVGRDAPLVLGERATHASNVWDFYKPNPAVEYPVVDGALSQECYYRALHDVYTRLCDTLETKTGKTANVNSHDYYCFHAPYNKLVQKSFARLFFIDAQRKYHKQQRGSEEEKKEDKKDEDTHVLLQEWISLPLEQTTTDKRLEQVLKQVSQDAFAKKLADANYASQLIGNTYTASVFFGLASLVDRVVSLTHGTTIALFSYGSGALATLYRIHVYVCCVLFMCVHNVYSRLYSQFSLSPRQSPTHQSSLYPRQNEGRFESHTTSGQPPLGARLGIGSCTRNQSPHALCRGTLLARLS